MTGSVTENLRENCAELAGLRADGRTLSLEAIMSGPEMETGSLTAEKSKYMISPCSRKKSFSVRWCCCRGGGFDSESDTQPESESVSESDSESD